MFELHDAMIRLSGPLTLSVIEAEIARFRKQVATAEADYQVKAKRLDG